MPLLLRGVGRPPSVAASGYTVSAAGETNAQGHYSLYGTNGGVANFKHDTNEYYLTRGIFAGPFNVWCLSGRPDPTISAHMLYAASGEDQATPPIETYSSGGNGQDPDAVVAAG